jgi:serine phosphatase RsbU (regulator of sigma subunit)
MNCIKILLIFLLIFFVYGAEAQHAKVDSLYKVYLKTIDDTAKVNLLIEMANGFDDKNVAKGVGFTREALELSERIQFAKGVCLSNILLGDYYSENLNYSEAIKHYLKATVVGENKKMYSSLSQCYNKIGIIYSNQKKNELCMKYFLKVAEIAKLQDKPKRYAIACNNIGIAYKDLGRYQDAKKYYTMALAEFAKTDFKVGIASVNNGLGTISDIMGDYDEALSYYRKAIAVFREANDSSMAAGLYTNIGEVYSHKKEYKTALDYYLLGLNVLEVKQSKNNNFRLDAYDGLSSVYANLKNYERAYYFKNRYLALKDSIDDVDGMIQVQEMEKRLDNEKQEKEIEILKQKDEIQSLKVKSQSEKIKRSNVIIYSVAGILLVVLLMSFFIYKAYKQIQKTNSELAEKKKEIQDSINYAKNIQEAMLPDVSLLKEHFDEGFGLYLPKDIVSGDFYWFNELNDAVYFAAADCTGHGVPGAFMSMIGIDKLNQSLIDNKIESPSGILASLNSSIKKALKQKDDSSASKDGMDIALCSYNKKTRTLNYAGANRPLWLLRGSEIIEYKATKASIAGYTSYNQVYLGHEIKVEIDDVIFIFTDGFADQFGGPYKKKYMSKQLKQTLIDVRHLPMQKQELKLDELFNAWRGNLEQVDDILVLGFKVKG